jgi:tetratricopeptide (TPR) repeat protein
MLKAQISSFTSVNIKDYRSKDDTSPFFKFQLIELDTLIGSLKYVSGKAEWYGINCETEIGFRVDKNNKIIFSDLQNAEAVIPEGLKMKDKSGNDFVRGSFVDSIKNDCIEDSKKLIASTEGLWFSDSTRADKELRIKISYITKSFERLNKQPKSKTGFIPIGNLFVPRDISLPYNLGVRKMNTGKTQLAKIYFERAVMLNKKDVDAYYNLGICYFKLKRIEDSCKCWAKCQELGDKTVSSQINKYCK